MTMRAESRPIVQQTQEACHTAVRCFKTKINYDEKQNDESTIAARVWTTVPQHQTLIKFEDFRA